MQNINEELEHDSLIQIILDHLVLNNFKSIKANIYGYNLPGKISWNDSEKSYIPDICCIHEGKKHIFRIETEQSITEEENAKIWSLFAEHANEYDKEFHLIVPNSLQKYVRELLVDLGIKAKVEEINKYCKILI